MRWKILTIITANVALAATFGGLAGRAGAPAGTPLRIAAMALAFSVVGLFSVRLEFRRQQATFTLVEAVFVVALFTVGPVGAGIAAAIGELAVWNIQRVNVLKVAFNSANQLCAATVAATGFGLVGHVSPTDPTAWFAALGAAVCFSLLNLASLTVVLSLAEGRRFQDLFFDSALTGTVVTLASAPLGIIALALYGRGPAGALLLVPIVIAVALNARQAASQRDEHLRFERLYASSSRLSRLLDLDHAVAAVAQEASELLTGPWAVCAAQDVAGAWIGAAVGPEGSHRAPGELLGALVDSAGELGGREVPAESLPAAVRAAYPRALSAAVQQTDATSPAPVLIMVLRDSVSGEDPPESRLQTLAAFVTHASMAIGNARLLGEVEESLRQQVDLNRQKGDFVAAVSHELRTPLTAMLGSVQTITRLKDRLDDDGRDRLLVMASEQGARLKRLIEELLTVAAAERPGMDCRHEPIDLRRLLVDVRNELRGVTAGRVVLDVAGGTTRIASDRLKLQQILVNLVENAGKYAPEGPIEVDVRQELRATRISVRDHGDGIPAHDRQRVFERFVQLDQSSTRRNGGTGLGLYLCRQLAEALGGRLDLDEPEGGGCRFTLSLPTGDVTAAQVAAMATAGSGNPADVPGVSRRPEHMPARQAPGDGTTKRPVLSGAGRTDESGDR